MLLTATQFVFILFLMMSSGIIFAGSNAVRNLMSPTVKSIVIHFKERTAVEIRREESKFLCGESIRATVNFNDGSRRRFDVKSGYNFKEDVPAVVDGMQTQRPFTPPLGSYLARTVLTVRQALWQEPLFLFGARRVLEECMALLPELRRRRAVNSLSFPTRRACRFHKIGLHCLTRRPISVLQEQPFKTHRIHTRT